MSVYGYIGCWQCRQYVFVGKWLRSESGAGFGFWHGGLGSSRERDCALGRMALQFIAHHLDHDVRGYIEGSGLDAEAADFENVDDEFARAAQNGVDEGS